MTATGAGVDVTVVIPTLNEVGVIDACLAQFDDAGQAVEVLVVDGGSDDGTRDRVAASGRARLVDAPRCGRSFQMNAGAAAASGSVLVFLHADCVLPGSWLEDVLSALADETAVGGRFRLAISDDAVSFRLIAFFSTLRSRYLGITYGDQAIFVRRSAFEVVGGFPPRMIFEDSEFCDAIEREGRFVMTRSSVVSSSRRWDAWGVWRTVFRMWYLRMLYAMSVPDERLTRMYRDVR